MATFGSGSLPNTSCKTRQQEDMLSFANPSNSESSPHHPPSVIVSDVTTDSSSIPDHARSLQTPTEGVPQKGIRRALDLYITAAIILGTTIILILLLNIVVAGMYFVVDGLTGHHGKSVKSNPATSPANAYFYQDGAPINTGQRSIYQLEWIDYHAYENLPPAEVSGMLDDFYMLSTRGFIFQPWGLFSEPPYTGTYVHVDQDERGFPLRRTANLSRIESLATVRIFVMGGSTSFGYSVSDEQTWPSQLSRILNQRARSLNLPFQIEVLNYGRGFYYPSQEVALLRDLFKQGHRPSAVIFLDGLNWGRPTDVPTFSDLFAQHFIGRQFLPERSLLDQFNWMPVARLIKAVQRWLRNPESAMPGKEKATPIHDPQQIINRFVQDWETARAICRQYNAIPFVFLQPDAQYNYPLTLYRREPPVSFLSARRNRARFFEGIRHASDITDLSNLFSVWGDHRKAIVDDVHYSPGFNRLVAEQVAQYAPIEKLKPKPSLIDEAGATGLPRS